MSEIKKDNFNFTGGLKKLDNDFLIIDKYIKDNPPAMGKTISEKKFLEQIKDKIFPEINKANDKKNIQTLQKNNNKKESSIKDIELDNNYDEVMKKVREIEQLDEIKKHEAELLSKRIEIQQMQDKIRAGFETLLQYYNRIEHLVNLKHWQNKYEEQKWFHYLQATDIEIYNDILSFRTELQNLKEPTKIHNMSLKERYLNETKENLKIINDSIQQCISSAQKALDECQKFFFEHNVKKQNKHKDTIKLTSQEPFNLWIDQMMENHYASRQLRHARLGSQIQSGADIYRARKDYGTNLVKQIHDKIKSKNEQNKLRGKKVLQYKDNSNTKYKPKNPTYLGTRRFLYDKQIREYIKNKNKKQYGTRLCDIESGQQFIV